MLLLQAFYFTLQLLFLKQMPQICFYINLNLKFILKVQHHFLVFPLYELFCCNLPLCVLAPDPLLPSMWFPDSRHPSGLSVSLGNAGKLVRPPRWKQCPCTGGSMGGTTPLFAPREAGGGVEGNGPDPDPELCLAVCAGERRGLWPAESGQERL